MLCCATLLVVVAWLQHELHRTLRLDAACGSARRRVPMAFLLWGAGLAALAYLATSSLLLGTGAAVHIDGAAICLKGSGTAVLPVPAETVAGQWLVRNLVLLGIALLAGVVATILLATAAFEQISLGRPRLVLAGAGVGWLLVTTLDHQFFGLYAIAANPVAADLVMHGLGIAMLAGSLRFRAGGFHGNREGTALGPRS